MPYSDLVDAPLNQGSPGCTQESSGQRMTFQLLEARGIDIEREALLEHPHASLLRPPSRLFRHGHCVRCSPAHGRSAFHSESSEVVPLSETSI